MASWSWTILSWAAFGAVAVSSVDTVYVTDIEIFTYLVRSQRRLRARLS